jgi:uncharacterized protein YlxW (UPF0749 family)
MFRAQELEKENKKLRDDIMDQLQKSIELLTDNGAVLLRIVQNQQEEIKDLQKRIRQLETTLNKSKAIEESK